jgi:hypothetical protein
MQIVGKAFLASAVTVLCVGCYVTSERSIVGTYRAEAPCATITLALNPDHSFVQAVRTSAGESKQLTGKWSFGQGADGNKLVYVDRFLDFREDYHGREGTGGTGFIPERWPRGILMGPVIVQCQESAHKIDYVK